MGMEEVKELKETLERVEGKLIAAANVYGAMNFAFWLVAMSLFFVLLGIGSVSPPVSLAYWGTAIAFGIYVSIKLWERIERLAGPSGGSKLGALMIGLSWAVGSIIGWWIIPDMTSIGVNAGARLAVGFLTFIGLSLLGQWFVMSAGRGHYEMIPSFLLPLLAIPVAMDMENGAMLWAGFVVAFSYGLTVLLYLYSAFKAIER
ncbi:hypothetical protein [Thermococcus sp.]|uniref:hypothetical protein n=1 Tax=Thermococcus sp. TaxID=35749 RepID=UPI0025D2AE8C|nr:hypothetical protein [Thermococcus sp.]